MLRQVSWRFWVVNVVIALGLLIISWRLDLPAKNGWFSWLVKPATQPSRAIRLRMDKIKPYLYRQRELILENERLRIRYSQLINQAVYQADQADQSWRPPEGLAGYTIGSGVIVLVRGNTLMVESRRLPADTGLAVYKNWLVGNWRQAGPYTAEVNLWSLPPVPLRIKITDDKGRFIADAILRQVAGQPVAANILRGVDLQGGEPVWLLSGKWEGLPFIGLIERQLSQDNVYQSWSIKFLWRDLIKPNDKLILVSLKE